MVLDVAHKIFSPKTYACNLCAITFDTFSENKSWKQFRERSTLNMEFLHIDEFESKYDIKTFNYPVVLSVENNNFKEFLSVDTINKIQSVEELTLVIEKGFQN